MQPPTVINSVPELSSYTPLAEYQASTPETFFGTKPVLHYHGTNCYVLISSEHLPNLPIFPSADGAQEVEGKRVFAVELFVNSANLTIYSHDTKKGIEIPYPAITLHAIQRLSSPATFPDGSSRSKGLYVQLDLAPPSDDDEFPDPVELMLLSAPSSSNDTSSTTDAPGPTAPEVDAVQALYDAVSACSDLHPDENADDDSDDGMDDRIVFESEAGGDSLGYESITGLPGAFAGATDGGLPPPFPGSGGWITAENVDQFFDKDGQFIGDKKDQENEDGKRTNGVQEGDDEQSAKRTRHE